MNNIEIFNKVKRPFVIVGDKIAIVTKKELDVLKLPHYFNSNNEEIIDNILKILETHDEIKIPFFNRDNKKISLNKNDNLNRWITNNIDLETEDKYEKFIIDILDTLLKSKDELRKKLIKDLISTGFKDENDNDFYNSIIEQELYKINRAIRDRSEFNEVELFFNQDEIELINNNDLGDVDYMFDLVDIYLQFKHDRYFEPFEMLSNRYTALLYLLSFKHNKRWEETFAHRENYTDVKTYSGNIPLSFIKGLSDEKLRYMVKNKSNSLNIFSNNYSTFSIEEKNIFYFDVFTFEVFRRGMQYELLENGAKVGRIEATISRVLDHLIHYPEQLEKPFNDMFEFLFDQRKDGLFISGVFNAVSFLEKIFPEEDFFDRLVVPNIDKLNDFDMSKDYMKLYYDIITKRKYVFYNKTESLLSNQDSRLIKVDSFRGSEFDSFSIMTKSLLGDNSENIDDFSQDLLKEIIKKGLEKFEGSLLKTSEKNRLYRILASFIHDDNLNISDKFIKTFFNEIGKLKLRKSVIYKIFGMPERLMGNSHAFHRLKKDSFFGRGFTEILSLVSDLDFQDSIKEIILQLSLSD